MLPSDYYRSMTYCEDFPACGHHSADPCAPQWYDAPDAFDTTVNPHALCDHEYGECNVDYYDDECPGRETEVVNGIVFCVDCGTPPDEH